MFGLWDLPNINFGLFISLLQFFGYFCPKNCSNEINCPENTQAKYFWKVSKNRTNEVHTDEIRVRQELPVLLSASSDLNT